jgi:hypothetical protein
MSRSAFLSRSTPRKNPGKRGTERQTESFDRAVHGLAYPDQVTTTCHRETQDELSSLVLRFPALHVVCRQSVCAQTATPEQHFSLFLLPCFHSCRACRFCAGLRGRNATAPLRLCAVWWRELRASSGAGSRIALDLETGSPKPPPPPIVESCQIRRRTTLTRQLMLPNATRSRPASKVPKISMFRLDGSKPRKKERCAPDSNCNVATSIAAAISPMQNVISSGTHSK